MATEALPKRSTIRPTDKGLLKTLKRLAGTSALIDPKDAKELLPVKVVAHVPSGNRLVGFKHADGRIFILGRANYND